MMVIVTVIFGMAAIVISLWSMHKISQLNHELEAMDRELSRMEAETATMIREASLRDLEEVGQ